MEAHKMSIKHKQFNSRSQRNVEKKNTKLKRKTKSCDSNTITVDDDDDDDESKQFLEASAF